MGLRGVVRRVWRRGRPVPQPRWTPGPDEVGSEASLEVLLKPYLPTDHARQVTATYYIDHVMRETPRPSIVMDLGCGPGNSVDLFRSFDPDIQWVGVDIAASREVRQRTRDDARFVTYDGTRLPFDDRSFDLVYSRQVLEHIQAPLKHLREVARVLRPNGAFIGSTSQLEPYHSRSYWNYTAFGLTELLTEAGLEVKHLRPGIDGMTLIERSFLGRPASFARWFTDESPLNARIDHWGRQRQRSIAEVNLRKLQYAGHITFYARRPGGPPSM